MNDVFGKYDPEKGKTYSREEYTVYEWEGKRLVKKTYSRKYIPASKTGYTDAYKSEVV